jgi:16S rRNA (adenine1518-N6/adenine1519-N6)-dimethyltransferase
VSRNAFRPVPNVDSTVLLITPKRPLPLQTQEERDLRTLTRTLFGQRRKQIQTVLRHAPAYQLTVEQLQQLQNTTQIDLRERPEDLAPERFIALAQALRAAGHPARRAA